MNWFAQRIIDDGSLPKAGQGDIQTIFNIAFVIFGALAVVFAVYAGIQLITSQGNSEKVATARRTLIYAVVGLVVIISASAIVGFVINAVS